MWINKIHNRYGNYKIKQIKQLDTIVFGIVIPKRRNVQILFIYYKDTKTMSSQRLSTKFCTVLTKASGEFVSEFKLLAYFSDYFNMLHKV